MKLLLDEMWPPDIALQLRQRGHDVIAVAERQDLRGLPDPAVFAAARIEERAIVTENVADYRPLAVIEIQRGYFHCGLIFSSNRRFPRHDPRSPGRLVIALHELLVAREEMRNQEYWLS